MSSSWPLLSVFTTLIVLTVVGTLILVGLVIYILTMTFEDQDEPDPPERPWMDSDEL